MKNFGIKRLSSEQESIQSYHLFDHLDRLMIVADHGSPWLAADPERYVRFAHPNGNVVATLDLSATMSKVQNGRQRTDYAIVLDDAVYAIISEYRLSSDSEDAPPYFVLNVQEQAWLALKGEDERPFFKLYDEVPQSLTSRYAEPIFAELPEPIGFIDKGTSKYDYAVTWGDDNLAHTPLLVMSLVFLVGRLPDA